MVDTTEIERTKGIDKIIGPTLTRTHHPSLWVTVMAMGTTNWDLTRIGITKGMSDIRQIIRIVVTTEIIIIIIDKIRAKTTTGAKFEVDHPINCADVSE